MTACRFCGLVALLVGLLSFRGAEGDAPFGIQVVDRASGRGVPLVELRTTNGILLVTDSAGWAAFDEPGLLGKSVWFHVRSHGYDAPRDGFGFEGATLRTAPGGRGRIELVRRNIAERRYRITGLGIYRDCLLLGEKPPIDRPLLSGGVMGQDSVVTARLGNRRLWFWGDTNRARHPLGLFEVAGAWSSPPDELDADVGVDLEYFTGEDGFARAMCPIEGPGPVWIDGLVVVPDGEGEVLIAHYARVQTLGSLYEQGLAKWNPAREVFEKWRELPLTSELHPAGHPVLVADHGGHYYVFPTPYPEVRVPATLEAVGDPAAYEAFTCLTPGTRWDPDTAQVERDAEGRAVWAWRRDTAPVNEARERELVQRGRMAKSEALCRLVDVTTGAAVTAHNGSIRWNPHRERWVWIVGESGGSSPLGEVWYAEADTLLGPWRYARKVVTHDDYSFYNVAQHDFLAKAGGRFVFFEGTYTRTFSGTQIPTPRYDYNQVMYRLDLDDPRLRMPVLIYEGADGQRGSGPELRATGHRLHDATPIHYADGAATLELPDTMLVLGTEALQ